MDTPRDGRHAWPSRPPLRPIAAAAPNRRAAPWPLPP
jgi:hypothetical protein